MRYRLFAALVVFTLVASACSATEDVGPSSSTTNPVDTTTTTTITVPVTTTTLPTYESGRQGDNPDWILKAYYGLGVDNDEKSSVALGLERARGMFARANVSFSGTLYVAGTEESFSRMQAHVFEYDISDARERTKKVNGFANYASEAIALNVWMMAKGAARRGISTAQGIVYVTLHEFAHILQYKLSGGVVATPLQLGLSPAIGGQGIRFLEASANFNAERSIARTICANEKQRECNDSEVAKELRDQSGVTLVTEKTSTRAFYSFLIERMGNIYVTEKFFILLGTYFERHPDEIPLSVLEDVMTTRSFAPVVDALRASLGREPTEQEIVSAVGAPWMRTIEDMIGLTEEEISQKFGEYVTALECEYGKAASCK